MTPLDISARRSCTYRIPLFLDYVVNVSSAKKKTADAQTENADERFFFCRESKWESCSAVARRSV